MFLLVKLSSICVFNFFKYLIPLSICFCTSLLLLLLLLLILSSSSSSSLWSSSSSSSLKCFFYWYASPFFSHQMEAIIERMQDEQTGVPVRTVKSFMSKIPSVFTGGSPYITHRHLLLTHYYLTRSSCCCCCCWPRDDYQGRQIRQTRVWVCLKPRISKWDSCEIFGQYLIRCLIVKKPHV